MAVVKLKSNCMYRKEQKAVKEKKNLGCGGAGLRWDRA